MQISKNTFKEIIEALRGQYDYDKAKSEKLTEIYGSDVQPTDNSRLTNQLFKILHAQFPPSGDFCDIQSFCYELDFGRKISFTEDPIGDLFDELNARL